MKIRIVTDRYKDIIKDIRSRVKSHEFQEWSAIDISTENGNRVSRILLSTEGEEQYRDVQIAFFGPSKENVELGFLYFDIVPKPSKDADLDSLEFKNKASIVLGKLTELLLNSFPEINEFTVYTK